MYIYSKIRKESFNGYIYHLVNFIAADRHYLDKNLLNSNVRYGIPEKTDWYFIIYKNYKCNLKYYNINKLNTKSFDIIAYIRYRTIMSF